MCIHNCHGARGDGLCSMDYYNDHPEAETLLQLQPHRQPGPPPSLPPPPPQLHLQPPATEELRITDDEFHVRKRIAILGAPGVGKTAVTIRCTEGHFVPDYFPTFEDSHAWVTTIDEILYEITIVDTDGQQGSSSLGLQYTIGVDGYILMFSVCDSYSFDFVKDLNCNLLRVLNVVNEKGTTEMPRILVGNQSDIVHRRQVDCDDAEAFANGQGIPYMETSACTGCNVNEILHSLIRIIDQNLRDSHNRLLVDSPPTPTNTPPLSLSPPPSPGLPSPTQDSPRFSSCAVQ